MAGYDFQERMAQQVSMGEVNFVGSISGGTVTATTIAIASQSTDGATNLVQLNPASTLTMGMDFDNGGANDGTLRYTGVPTKHFHCAITISGKAAAANKDYIFAFAVNGEIQVQKSIQKFGNTSDIQSTALHACIPLSTNDKLTLYVGNLTDASDFDLTSLNIFALGI